MNQRCRITRSGIVPQQHPSPASPPIRQFRYLVRQLLHLRTIGYILPHRHSLREQPLRNDEYFFKKPVARSTVLATSPPNCQLTN
uniref:Uncharacterized protein n=1 Tax=Panagrellus redivivus TaxID=6233 RepID=A0A7E4ZR67_PANRE